MWFKNLCLYRFTEPFTLSAAELEEKLQTLVFKPCGNHELFRFGWTPPLGRHSQQLIHSANGFFMICGKKQEKVLPMPVVNERLTEKIEELENQLGKKPTKKQRDDIKDEIIFELLPKAFAFSKKTYAYIDPNGGWLIIDVASTKKAEEILSHLRKCIDTLPAAPIITNEKPVSVMTQWLTNQQPPINVNIENECELRSPDDEGAIIRCKRHDLSLPEIKNHLDSGKQVIKLSISWADRLSFIIDENMAIKRLKFLDLIQEQASDIETTNEAEQFDADFSIMSLELAGFLPRLLEWFGGESKI
jgi:recombination associated protein RdgC